MVAFGHTAVGAIVGVIGYQTFGHGNLALGLIETGILGVFSHYIFDLIPHGHFFNDPKKYKKYIPTVIVFDLALPVLFLLWLGYSEGKSTYELLYILFGIGGSQLPDVLDGLGRLKILPRTGLFKTEKAIHHSTHWHGKDGKALLFTVFDFWQVLIFGLAILVITNS